MASIDVSQSSEKCLSKGCEKHTKFCSFKLDKEKCRNYAESGSMLCKEHQEFCIHDVNDPRIIITGNEIDSSIIFDGPVWLGKTPEGKALSELPKKIKVGPKTDYTYNNGRISLHQTQGGSKKVTYKGPVYSDRSFRC